MINVLGDSHAQRFVGPLFRTYYLMGATAYNMIKENSSTRSRRKAFIILQGLDKTDCLVLSFGEIDIKSHMFKYVTEKNTISSVAKECVERYILFLEEVKSLGFKNIVVFGPPATTPRWTEDEPTIFGSEVQRNYMTFIFTKYLSKRCKELNIEFISIFKYLVDNNLKSIEMYYEEDMVHIKPEFQSSWFLDELSHKVDNNFDKVDNTK